MTDNALPRLATLLLAATLLAACQEPPPPPRHPEPPAMQDLADIRADLAFTCVREADAIPAREPRADQLYRHARWLRRENLRLDNPAHYPPIERLLRIAAAWDHDLANLELRRMIERGQARSANPLGERLALTEALIARGIPGGYYDMARMLETGSAVARDPVLALRYYRKAADLGSPEAQYVVGTLLVDRRKVSDDIV
ncbi:tetratricopeptide repeat protein, partial [Pseudothauera lacus]